MSTPDAPTQDWLTTSQAAARIERTPLRVRQLANEGKLRAVWTPLGRLIDPDSVDAFLRARAERAASAAETVGGTR